MNRFLAAVSATCALFLGGLHAAPASAETAADSMKTIATGLLTEGLAKADRAYIMAHVAEGYIQHNPVAADGRAGLLAFVDYIETLDPPLGVRPVRVLAEGDLVVIQSEYDFFGPKVIFDLFRFEDGKLAEHWDAMQEVPATTASGRGMTDGTVGITDLDQTAANKALVTGLINEVFMQGKIDRLDAYIAPGYMQHNPFVADGLDGLKGFIAYLAENKIPFAYKTLHNVVAEGNFVFTQVEGMYDGKPTAFYDLWRVEGGKIVEHWDSVQEVPATMAHGNGMF